MSWPALKMQLYSARRTNSLKAGFSKPNVYEGEKKESVLKSWHDSDLQFFRKLARAECIYVRE